VGAVLLRLLPQIRSFSSRLDHPGPLSHQARIQKPVGGPEEPGLRCCSAPHPGRTVQVICSSPTTTSRPSSGCWGTATSRRP
jgi:hypothetical protein